MAELSDKQRRQNARASYPKGYPQTDSEYADPKNKKYPVDTKERTTAAWDYIHKEKNRREYSSSELSAIESRIRKAAKKFGITLSE